MNIVKYAEQLGWRRAVKTIIIYYFVCKIFRHKTLPLCKRCGFEMLDKEEE